MNAPRLTDAQISQALRAHLPERAQAGLLERVVETTETTSQQRALPSFLGALSDADPVSRRRSLLIAAALLIALALATAAAVGAWRLLQRDRLQDLSLEPPADVRAFVLSSYERLPDLPPVAMTWRDNAPAKGRIYVHRSGAVRLDRFTSVEATEPASSTILRDHRLSGMATVGTDKVWLEEGSEDSFGDDPRVFIRTVLRSHEGPGCEMERDPSEVGSGTAATGWTYVGVEYVAGRPTHHFACVGDIWLDIETRLILKTRAPVRDDADNPIPGQFRTTEVTEIAFGDQPAALFEPPEGIARMTGEAYHEYLCTRGPMLPNKEVWGLGAYEECPSPESEATPEPSATPAPTPTPGATMRPIPSGPAGPLAWRQARLDEDWPAPVRPEPVGGTIIQPLEGAQRPEGTRQVYPDPSGDTGSAVLPWIDIQEVQVNEAGTDLWIELATNFPPAVDPGELWIAFGLVVDTDRDGVPDVRYGMDNLPRATRDEAKDHRAWRTDLHTGQTVAGGLYGDLEGGPHTSWPGVNGNNGLAALFDFGGGDTTGGGTAGGSLEAPLYAWASVIENGRVVATDYAPDVGWLDPAVTTKP